MKHSRPHRGEVELLWRFKHCWRNGSNHDRHWKSYAIVSEKDARAFLKRWNGIHEMFEYKIRSEKDDFVVDRTSSSSYNGNHETRPANNLPLPAVRASVDTEGETHSAVVPEMQAV